jgi:hypothetical protein
MQQQNAYLRVTNSGDTTSSAKRLGMRRQSGVAALSKQFNREIWDQAKKVQSQMAQMNASYAAPSERGFAARQFPHRGVSKFS